MTSIVAEVADISRSRSNTDGKAWTHHQRHKLIRQVSCVPLCVILLPDSKKKKKTQLTLSISPGGSCCQLQVVAGHSMLPSLCDFFFY